MISYSERTKLKSHEKLRNYFHWLLRAKTLIFNSCIPFRHCFFFFFFRKNYPFCPSTGNNNNIVILSVLSIYWHFICRWIRYQLSVDISPKSFAVDVLRKLWLNNHPSYFIVQIDLNWVWVEFPRKVFMSEWNEGRWLVVQCSWNLTWDLPYLCRKWPCHWFFEFIDFLGRFHMEFNFTIFQWETETLFIRWPPCISNH